MGYYQLISMMPKTPGIDPDAQAFITAASITDPTQQTAINNLVTGLKTDGIWTKMKALYPFVGGTASAHKFNLKDPRDLDAAFRLVFNGGWTHSSTGATPNGTNAFADTKLIPSTNLTLYNTHFSFYSRTNSASDMIDFGSEIVSGNRMVMHIKWSDNNSYHDMYNQTTNRITYAMGSTASAGLFLSNRSSNTLFNVWRNSTKLATNTNTSATSMPTASLTLGVLNSTGQKTFYSNRQCAFASIGDGLTDTDAANLYTRVQAYQTELGRSIGTQTVSDADAQAFVTNANIQDQVQATAVNNLVIGLKADSIWTKMKAIYPFVGGDASSHKFNLKNPLDTDAAFRLVFSGGWTHSSTGALPNGTNAYADTFLNANSSLSINSAHLSFYSRTQNTASGHDIGCQNAVTGQTIAFNLYTYYLAASLKGYYQGTTFPNGNAGINNTNTLGFQIGNTINNNSRKLHWNGNILATNSDTISNIPNVKVYIGATNGSTAATAFSPRQCAFASIGDGLTDIDAANLYTRVQAYQTALSRQV